MRCSRFHLSFFLLATGFLVPANPANPANPATLPVAKISRSKPVDFQSEILPILRANCLACHNQTKSKADVILETPQDIAEADIVVPGKPSESLLFQTAIHSEDPAMPPADNKVSAKALNPNQLGLLKLWIEQGAKGEVRAARKMEWQSLPPGLNPIYSSALSPDGRFAAAGRANQIFLYDITGKKLITRLTDRALIEAGNEKQGVSHRDLVHSMAFHPNGELLASGGFREVKLWRRQSITSTKQFPAPAAKKTDPTNRGLVAFHSTNNKTFAQAAGNSIQLRNLSDGKNVKTLTGHNTPVRAMAFSPDYTYLFTAAQDGTVRLWKTGTGNSVAPKLTLPNPSKVTTVAWTSNGKFLVTSHEDKIIRSWAAASAIEAIAAGEAEMPELKPHKELKGHGQAISALIGLARSPMQILSASRDGTMRHWDANTGQAIRSMTHGAPVTAVAVSRDGSQFASAGENGTAKIWTSANGKQLVELKGARQLAEEVAEKNRFVAFAKIEVTYHTARLKSMTDNAKKADDRLKKANEALQKAEAAPIAEKKKALETARAEQSKNESNYAKLKAGYDQEVKQFNTLDAAAKKANAAAAKAKEEKDQLQKAAAEKRALANQSKAKRDQLNKDQAAAKKKLDDGVKKVTAAEAEYKKLEDARKQAFNESENSKKAQAKAAGEKKTAEAQKIAADQQQAAATAGAGKAAKALAQAAKPVRTIAFSVDGKSVVTDGDGDGDGKGIRSIRIWDVTTGKEKDGIGCHQGAVSFLAWPESGAIFSVGATGEVAWCSPEAQWKLERTIGTGDEKSPIIDRAAALAFSRNGTQLAVGSGEPSRSGTVQVFSVADGKLTKNYPEVHSDTVMGLQFNASGTQIASGSADKFTKVTQLSDGKILHAFEGHTHHVLGVAWQHNGRILASVGADKEIRVWNLVTGSRAGKGAGYAKEITSIHFVGYTDQAVLTAGDNRVRRIAVPMGNPRTLRDFGGTTDFVYTSAVSADGKIIIAGGEASVLRVWNGTNGQSVISFAPPAEKP